MKRCLRCGTTFDTGRWDCPACEFAPAWENGYPVLAPELARHNDGYTADFFAHLAQMERGHFWFEARNRLLLWAVEQYFPDARTVFEIGCGTGFVLQKFDSCLPDVALYGSDLLVEALHFAAQRVPSAELIQMDARDIPYEQEFDLIGAFDVIEHIEDDALALAQMYRAIKPGGGIMITVPQHPFLWSETDDLSYHKRRYTQDELVSKVQAAGFRVLKTTSFVSLLLPLMLVNRLRNGRQNKPFDFYAEFKLNSMLNALFSKTMAFEIMLIQQGLSFPLGGSRICIGVRPES